MGHRRPARAGRLADRLRPRRRRRRARSPGSTSRRSCSSSAARTRSSCSSHDDLDAVVEQAVGGRLENTGQACNAAKRFIVLDDLYDAFVEKFTAALTEVEPGDPTSADTDDRPALLDRRGGPAGGAGQGGARRRRASSPPAAAATATSSRPPCITDITQGEPRPTPRSSSARSRRSTRSAPRPRRSSSPTTRPYGLGSYVFTSDSEQALRVADQIEAGMVFINAVGAEGVELPFGGVKASGFGRELGRSAPTSSSTRSSSASADLFRGGVVGLSSTNPPRTRAPETF